jgi:hypothetical protein
MPTTQTIHPAMVPATENRWMFVDIAVRDIVLALGTMTRARLTPIVSAHERALHP